MTASSHTADDSTFPGLRISSTLSTTGGTLTGSRCWETHFSPPYLFSWAGFEVLSPTWWDLRRLRQRGSSGVDTGGKVLSYDEAQLVIHLALVLLYLGPHAAGAALTLSRPHSGAPPPRLSGRLWGIHKKPLRSRGLEIFRLLKREMAYKPSTATRGAHVCSLTLKANTNSYCKVDVWHNFLLHSNNDVYFLLSGFYFGNISLTF